MKPAALLAVAVLVLIAVAHLLRLILGLGIVIDGIVIPMWPSLLATAGLGLLAWWLWREQRAVGGR